MGFYDMFLGTEYDRKEEEDIWAIVITSDSL